MSNLAVSSLFAALPVLCCTFAQAVQVSDLYRTQAVVTGQSEANRATGLAECIDDVVVKVSGDPRLADDPRVAAMAAESAVFVTRLRYRDRLEGKPIHDKQGAYDRPHDLVVDFDRSAVNAALQSMGRKPWLRGRPELLVRLTVRKGGSSFVVTADGDRDQDMRDSLAANAGRVGLDATLPAAQDLALPWESAENAVPLDGTLTWSDAAHGWIADWRITDATRAVTWRVSGAGYDDAFRSGLRGAAQVLSGNGDPS